MTKLFLLTTFLVSIINYSQENSDWINYTSNEFVNSIVEDQNILWIGTNGGLLKLNRETGEKIYYNKANSGLPDNNVNSIILDSLGTLICATNKGLVKFKDDQWSLFNPSPNPENLNPFFTFLAYDKMNNLLVGSAHNGLFIFNGSDWDQFYVASEFGVDFPGVEIIAVDSSNTIWLGAMGNIATNGYLAKFDGTEIIKIETIDSIHSIMQVYSIVVDQMNKICVGYDGGYCEFDGSSWTNYSYSNILSVLVDEYNVKWLTSFGGLYKFENSFTHIDTPYPIFEDRNTYCALLTSNNSKIFGTSRGLVEYSDSSWTEYELSFTKMKRNETYSFIEDNNRNIWIGTIDGLLSKNDQNWLMYDRANSGLSDTWIFDLEIDDGNNLWIGTCCNGITKYNGQNWTVYDENELSTLDNGIQSINKDIDGSIWFGSWGNGLTKFDGNDFINFTKENSQLPDNFIRSIAIEDNGIKWIGTDNGILKIDGDNWSVYNSENSAISNHGIWSIAIDRLGNKWFGTTGDGLYNLSGDDWIHYTKSNSELPDDTIYSLEVDINNVIWIGTRFRGIARFDQTHWMIFNEDNSPLPDNEVRDLFFDKDGHLWVATMNGVAVYKDFPVNVKNESILPTQFSLSQNYPNPFNPTTTIEYQIPVVASDFRLSKITLKVHDILGREVATLVNQHQKPGNYKTVFDASNLSSGIYYYSLIINNDFFSKKMILLK